MKSCGLIGLVTDEETEGKVEIGEPKNVEYPDNGWELEIELELSRMYGIYQTAPGKAKSFRIIKDFVVGYHRRGLKVQFFSN